MATKKSFLRWALVNVAFIAALIAARVNYEAHIPGVAWAAILAVLAVYGVASFHAARLSWRDYPGDECWAKGLGHIERAASYCPKIAMLGTVSGFLIAFSGDTSDVAQRVRGASTGLAATFIGIACMLALEWIHHVLEVRGEQTR